MSKSNKHHTLKGQKNKGQLKQILILCRSTPRNTQKSTLSFTYFFKINTDLTVNIYY